MKKLNELIKCRIDNAPCDVALEIVTSMGYEKPTYRDVEAALTQYLLFHELLYDEEVWNMPVKSHYKTFNGKKCQTDIYVVSELDTFCPDCNRDHIFNYCLCIEHNADDEQSHVNVALLETLNAFKGFPLMKAAKTYKNVRGILEDYSPDIIAEVEENNYEE